MRVTLTLHVEYAERGNQYGILFIFSLYHPQTYHLPQAEGVLLHVFDNQSRASGAWRAYGHALHVLCLAGLPMGWPSYV